MNFEGGVMLRLTLKSAFLLVLLIVASGTAQWQTDLFRVNTNVSGKQASRDSD